MSTPTPSAARMVFGEPTTWVAGLWGVVAGLVLSLATAFFAESGPRVSGHLLSVGVALAALGVPLVVGLTAWLASSGWVGVAPWTSWLLFTTVLGTKTHEGSILLLGKATSHGDIRAASGHGTYVLYVGALVGAIAVGAAGTARRTRAKALAQRPGLAVGPVGDGDPEGGEGVSQPV